MSIGGVVQFEENLPIVFAECPDTFTVEAQPSSYQVTFEAYVDIPDTVVICDAAVAALHSELRVDMRLVATEATKALNTGVAEVVATLQRCQATRNTTIVAIGGGIIQDTVGFAASVYKRGVPWIYVPTTLLAMCDSCIGGKVGVNHLGVKNLLGVFSNPTRVIVDTRFLATLPSREIANGTGEMLKFGVLGGPAYIDHICACKDDPARLIKAGLSLKKAVIERDQFDRAERQSLNLGHTVGHALESGTDYAIPHGVAVAFGIDIVRQCIGGHHAWGLAYHTLFDSIRASVPALPVVDRAKFKMALSNDKKNHIGTVCFPVMVTPAKCVLEHSPLCDALVDALLSKYDDLRT